MFSTLKFRFLAVCVLICLTFGATAALGIYGVGRFVDDVAGSTLLGKAVRNHTLGDMMHDALRSDVYAALAADEAKLDRAKIIADFDEHIALFNRVIAENEALPLPAETRAALAEVRGPLDRYVAAARQIGGLAFTDRPAALARLPDFETQYEALEGAMETAGDRIEMAATATEAAASAFGDRARVIAFGMFVAGALACGGLIWFTMAGVTRPIARVEETMRRLATGDTAVEIPYAGGKGEIGSMADSIVHFRSAIMAQHTADRARVAEEQAAERMRQSAMMAMAAQIETETAKGAQNIGAGATNLRTSVERMRDSLGSASAAVREVVGETEASRKLTEEAAGLSTDVLAAIREIVAEVERGSALAGDAVTRAERSRATVDALSRAADEIGQIVGVIEEVAERTNLLALNATIEAARAGEAGRGFAVVASEVKGLASQTAKSTTAIAAKINEIQGVARQSGQSLADIGEAIGKLNQVTATIAAAIDRQRQATEGFSALVGKTNGSVSVMASRMGGVAGEVMTSVDSAQQVASLAIQLIDTSDALLGRLPVIIRESMSKVDAREHQRLAAHGLVEADLGDRSIKAQVGNVSAGGLQLLATVEVKAGTRIRLRFPDGDTVDARVVWVQPHAVGLAFDRPRPDLAKRYEIAAA